MPSRSSRCRSTASTLHFIHVRSKAPNAMPLLLVHGWPGSIVEFLGLIPRLTEHFTMVAPSLPGYTLSFAPGQKRFGVEDIAATFIKLMTEVLGYRKFGTQGGDWGAFITSRMAAMRPERATRKPFSSRICRAASGRFDQPKRSAPCA